MIGENRQLVTNEPVEFEKKRLKFRMAERLPIFLEEVIEYTPIIKGKHEDVSIGVYV